MKPKARTEHEDGLLEYLEDIIGTSSLKPEIEELTNRVETLSQERTAKLQRVQAVEREKTRLEGSKNEAVKFIRMENQLAIAQNAFIQANKLAAVRSTETVKQEMVCDSVVDLMTLFLVPRLIELAKLNQRSSKLPNSNWR